MKLINEERDDIETIGEPSDTHTASVATEDMSFLFDMFSTNLYKNAIGSIVREITSNCFDSHIEAKVDDAVVVGIREDDGGKYVYFQDVGVGLSPDRMSNIYINYLKSTKRGTNDQIGCWGIGSKSPLAYTDIFYITTRFEGVEYNYMFYKGKTAPTLELLSEDSTTKHNGTTIKIYLKDDADEVKFINEFYKQLAYFDNVYFDGVDVPNKYIIFEGEHFKFRSTFTKSFITDNWNNRGRYYPTIHICIGKVAYEIDYTELGIDPIACPIALKFNIGDLNVLPSRETIKYTDDAKTKILAKIQLATAEIVGKFKEQQTDATDIFDFIRRKDIVKPYRITSPDGGVYEIAVTGLGVDGDDLRLKYKPDDGLVFTPNEDRYFSFLEATKEFGRGGVLRSARHRVTWLLTSGRFNPRTIKYHTEEIGKVKMAYLKDGGDAYFIKPLPVYSSYKKICKLLGLEIQSEGNRTTAIIGSAKLVYAYRKAVTRDILNYGVTNVDTLEPSEAWLADYKAKHSRKSNVEVGEVLVQELIHVGSNEHGEYKLEARIVPLSVLKTRTGFTIYGTRESREMLEAIHTIICQRKSLYNKYEDNRSDSNIKPFYVYQVAIQNLKFLKNMNNGCFVTNASPKIRVFRDVVTAYRIRKLKIEYINEFVQELAKYRADIAEKLRTINTFAEENFRIGIHRQITPTIELLDAMYVIAEEQNLWNPEIIEDMLAVEKFFEKVPLLKHFGNNRILPNVPEQEIVDYIKSAHIKLDPQWYQTTLTFPEPEETLIVNEGLFAPPIHEEISNNLIQQTNGIVEEEYALEEGN